MDIFYNLDFFLPKTYVTPLVKSLKRTKVNNHCDLDVIPRIEKRAFE